jgi:hypothetical protein
MKKTILALALAAGLTSFAGSAKAELTYDWSFTADPNWFHAGIVSGTVTFNEIDNGWAYATSVYVTKFKGDFAATINPTANFINPGTSGGLYLHLGQISGGIYGSDGLSDGLLLNFRDNLNVLFAPEGLAGNTYGQNNIPGALTFVPAGSGADTAAVPEPSQVAASLLLAAGIAGFAIVKRRQEASDLEALAA